MYKNDGQNRTELKLVSDDMKLANLCCPKYWVYIKISNVSIATKVAWGFPTQSLSRSETHVYRSS
jgi:hypothetical protein